MCQIWQMRSSLAAAVALGWLVLPRAASAEEWARGRAVFSLAPDAPGAPTSSKAQGPRWVTACSFRYSLCVVGAPGTEERLILEVLSAADRAWGTLTEVLNLPPPYSAWGSPWRLYLVDGVEGNGSAIATGTDPLARFDRGASFGVLDRRTPLAQEPCALDLAVARAVARGSLWSGAPATDPGSSIGESESLARLVTACSAGNEDAETFQASPETTLVDPGSAPFDRGGALFFDWLDARFGGQPGAIVPALWALSPTRTEAKALSWAARPTGFDVLRASLKGALWAESTLDDALLRFAVYRVSVAPPPRLAWDIPWPSAARRLAPPESTSPTGASYIAIHLGGAPRGAKVRLIAEWEDFGRMRWGVLKLAPSGQTLAELDITSPDKATRAATVIEGLEGVDRLLVIGVGLGSTTGPFDPGAGSWASHGWLLTVETE
jgi:hypothetical protein